MAMVLEAVPRKARGIVAGFTQQGFAAGYLFASGLHLAMSMLSQPLGRKPLGRSTLTNISQTNTDGDPYTGSAQASQSRSQSSGCLCPSTPLLLKSSRRARALKISIESLPASPWAASFHFSRSLATSSSTIGWVSFTLHALRRASIPSDMAPLTYTQRF
jgi:hypothetical protein